jgi:hypothetical protein
MTTLDDSFINRVYRTSAYLWAFGLLVCAPIGGLPAALGWTLGAAVSMGTLCSLEWIVRREFVPGKSAAGRSLARFSLVKLPIVALMLVGIVLVGGRSFEMIASFCAGVVLTQTVVFLKVMGMLANQWLQGRGR